jgi:4-aminobutyrate aminotransferase-like enzyme
LKTETQRILDLLEAHESRNVTFMARERGWPLVWERARGTHVWDADRKRYLDLTAAFGVAAAGHANPRVVRAGQKQMAILLHAMGDVHPHAGKAELAKALSGLTFERWTGPAKKKAGKVIFCNSGFEAVEAALKTALIATNKPGVIAFHGAYHGLGYGALNATHRQHFRGPFERQLRQFAHFVPFPGTHGGPGEIKRGTARSELAVATEQTADACKRVMRRHSIGAVLVEPVQARGGINVPPPDFLPMLRRLCDEHEALLIVDEIYTGFGRTGRWFACEHTAVVPDLICLGKALTGGFPLSACVGRADLMDAAWPRSSGEAIHTSTFLGHPVGCAMALANIAEIRRLKLVEQSRRAGRFLNRALASIARRADGSAVARGLGLMAGLELRQRDGKPDTKRCLDAIEELLRRGFIFLPEGEHANVLGFTPPLTISERELARAVDAVTRVLVDT